MARRKKDVIEAEARVKNTKKKGKRVEAEQMEKEKLVDDFKDSNSGKKYTQKAFFFPRVISYIIDIIIVSMVASFIMVVLPRSENYDIYLQEYEQVQADLIENKITVDEYIQRSIEVVHDLDYSNVVSMVVEVVLLILYFVVFQCYNKGQTLGKKIMNIRVVSSDGERLTFNHYIYRSVIIHSLLANILIIGMVLFIDKSVYYYASFTLQGIQILLIIISVFMVMYKKDGRGLQDLVGHTRVIMCNEE
ncbi:MAG: RDD family protein [bacterium]|nr:RDD family protein [bacterium]